jgi:hypothetical protein
MGTRSFRPLVAPFVVGITTRLFGNKNNNRQQQQQQQQQQQEHLFLPVLQ